MLANTSEMQSKAGVTKMNIVACQVFAQLCEGYLTEASTSLDLVKSKPGGKEVVKYLHSNNTLSHDQEYNPVMKIQWSELKDGRYGSWVIIQGDNGIGAIRAYSGSYTAIASNGGPVQTFKNDRGGNIIDFLKGQIGQLRKFYVGADENKAKLLKQARAKQQQTLSAPLMDQSALVKKFKPLWLKAIRAAQADIKGMVANMIKNDAYDKAKRKLNMLEELDTIAESIEAGDNSDSYAPINRAVGNALTLAAGYHYPEQTGEITRGRYGDNGLNVANGEGRRLLIKDISEGDQAKLSTVLAFFKRNLITG